MSKNKFIFALVCNIVYAGQLFMTKSDIILRRWRHANIFWHRWSSLLNRLLHRLTTPWPSLATTPAYNDVAVSRDHTGLQRGGQFARLHRLTTPRTTRPSALAAGSRVRAGLQRAGQLARPHRLTTPRPTHLPAPVADSPVSDFNVT